MKHLRVTKSNHRWKWTLLCCSFTELLTAMPFSCSMNRLNKKMEVVPLRYTMTMVKRRGRCCTFFWQQKLWNRGRHAVRVNTGSLSLSLLPTLPWSLSLHCAIVHCPPTSPSSGWDWSSSRWPQTGLGAAMAPVILCGFGSVTAAWLGCSTLITLPPGGLRVAQRVTSSERGKASIFTWE